MFDGGGGLDGLHLESSADVGKRAGAKRQRLGVMGLPSLVLGTEIKSARVLKVRRQDDGLIAGLAGQLDTEIPRVEGHEGKLEILANEVFLGKSVETVDGIAESTCRANMLPSQSGQARCQEAVSH